MSPPRPARWQLLLACSAAVLACDRPDATPVPESARDSSAATPQAAMAASGRWVAELGPVLVVPSDSPAAAIVLFPDSPTSQLLASGALTLLSPGGESTGVRGTLSDGQVCGGAAMVQFDADVASGWSVGLFPGSGVPLRLDSIESLPSADSSVFAADLARLASAVPIAKGSRFQGLPFVVLSASRFDSQGRTFVVSHLVRRVPQEATPLEEHTFIIAERSASAPRAAPYQVSYHQRSESSEEAAEHFVVLSAIQAAGTTMLLISRDQEMQSTIEVLERLPGGTWQPRWSRVLRC